MFHSSARIDRQARAQRPRYAGLLYVIFCLTLLAAPGAHAAGASAAALDPTVLVKDLNPATAPSTPDDFMMVGGKLFFTAFDPNHGRELWRSDGTAGGTILLKDIYEGPQDGGISHLTSFKNALYFTAYNHQRPQLWRSDGTSVGTTLVHDFANPPYESYALGLAAVNNALFVLTESQGNINNHNFIVDAPLWRSDGTPAGTSRIFDFMSVPNFSIATDLTGIGNTLFLRVLTSTNQILYRSDGTTRGTFPLAQFAQNSSLYGNVDQFTVVNNTLFFRANQIELWRSDGSAAGTALIKLFDLYADPSSPGPLHWPIQLRDAIGSTLLFYLQNPNGYKELWRSDGTPAGTVPLPELTYNPGTHPVLLNGQWFFAGCGLLRSDSSLSSIVKINDPCLSQLLTFNNQLVFSTSDGPVPGVYISDGTAAGTVSLTQFPSESGGLVDNLASDGNRLFFRYQPASGDSELWTSDGTPGGTYAITTLPPDSEYSQFTGVNGHVVFGVRRRDSPWPDLWISDGSAAGTLKVKEQLIGPYPSLLTIHGTALFAIMTSSGTELWKSDGTLSGTQLVAPITKGTLGFSDAIPHGFSIIHNAMFFQVEPEYGRSEIWRSDGTTAGTHPLQGVETTYSGGGLTLSDHNLFVVAMRGELRAVPVSDGVDEYAAAPDTAFAPAHGQGFIPIVYANRGVQIASRVTLSVTLPDGLGYAGDDSGVAPSQSGSTLTWSLPDAGFLDTQIIHLRVTTPAAPLGTRYPVTIALSSAEPDANPANNNLSIQVQLARQLFVPLTIRPCVYTYTCSEPL